MLLTCVQAEATTEAKKEERPKSPSLLAKLLAPFKGDKKQFIDDLEQALYASKIISYTQGFMLMRQTAAEVSISRNGTE